MPPRGRPGSGRSSICAFVFLSAVLLRTSSFVTDRETEFARRKCVLPRRDVDALRQRGAVFWWRVFSANVRIFAKNRYGHYFSAFSGSSVTALFFPYDVLTGSVN